VRPEIQFRESSNFDVFNKRIGQLGKSCGKLDNRLYTVRGLFGFLVECLVDTVSTTTLLSCRMYEKSLDNAKPNLEPTSLNIRDVNGNTICTYGQSILDITFREMIFPQTIIVCDITPDAIIGQDFLLKWVKQIDYQKLVL
jgi:hypothetical protein